MRHSRIFILVILFTMLFSKSYGQFSSTDFVVKNNGISEKYFLLYKEKEKIEELAAAFNEQKITHSIAPITIILNYEDDEAYVIAEISFDLDKVFSEYSDYTLHNYRLKRRGTGISILLQNQIFSALSSYKKSVATKGYQVDNNLLNIKSAIKLEKANGDWMYFYAYNYLNSRGFYPFTFYKNVHLKVNGKSYETESSDVRMLNEMKYFFTKSTKDLSGARTGAFYFCDFFNIKTE